MIGNSQHGDVAVFTLSSHGTWVSDEHPSDEPESRDEAFMAHDGEIIVDDELRRIIETIKPGVNLTVIIDSCYSGSGTRAQQIEYYQDATTDPYETRYTAPSKEKLANNVNLIHVKKKFLAPESNSQESNSQESNLNEILITACASYEICYETFRNGRFNGAMTNEAIRIMREYPRQTYRQFHERLRQYLPSNRYPQRPQLEGSDINKSLQLFSGRQS